MTFKKYYYLSDSFNHSTMRKKNAFYYIGYYYGWACEHALVILITLKLAGAIAWPWYLVIAPVWAALAFIGLVAVILVIGYFTLKS